MKVAVLGASGVVGQECLKVMAERNFPVDELKLLASKRSAGKKLLYCGKEYTYEEATDNSFEGMDIVIGAADNATAKQFAPAIKKAGAVFIDNSSAFRLDEEVPLVVPEINPEDVKKHNGIIANPNCVTIIALVALSGLVKDAKIKTLFASSYQAASGAGKAGLEDLNDQVKVFAKDAPNLEEHPELLNKVTGKLDESSYTKKCFTEQIAFNLIPRIGDITSNGYSKEEMKLQNEGRKILHMPDMLVSCTCIRVPVFRSHSISINVAFDKDITVDEARDLIKKAPGCVLLDDVENDKFPTPLISSDQDLVYVGRIRKDLVTGGLALWCCGDQIRKGAASNAIQIAELLVK